MGKWTVDTLKEHYDKILIEKDSAIKTAFDSARQAVEVAEKNAEKWRANANEWRSAMNDRERTFVSKGEFEEYRRSVDKALVFVKEKQDKGEGHGSGVKDLMGWIIAAITILGFIISNLIKK